MKKFIKKMIKKTEGFTLVELIVVIAILGILAGVAVPAYSGYLAKAEEAKVTQTLSAVYTAAAASLADTGHTVSTIGVSGGEVTLNGTKLLENDEFFEYFDGNSVTGITADYASGKWTIS